jgi:DNA-binding PadR family transcriptional regulator
MGTTPTDAASMTHLSFQVLLALSDADRHGYGIIKEIEQRTEGGLIPSTGALYLALQRLVQEGLIEGAVGPVSPGDDARRRYYRMTEEGRRRAAAEARRLARLVGIALEKRLVPKTVLDMGAAAPRRRDG